MENKDICIITSHGFTGYPEEMQPLGDYLLEKGYSWHNLTIPGHGTTPEDLKTKKWTDWTSYVKSEVEKKQSEYPVVIMSGLSMGGSLTLWALENIPSLSAGITLAASIKIMNFFQSLFTFLPVGWWMGRSETDMRDILDKQNASTHRAYTRFHTDSAKELHKLVTNVRKNLYKINQPLLMFHSIKDQVLPIKNVEVIYNNVSSKVKEKVILENSGHVLTRDYDRDYIFKTIDKFIQSLVKNE